MAKGGGGSWKVAYADFVTAMMAFFLVMWIGAQDVKVRQSVANYFVDPSGVSKAPKSGGLMEDPSPGSVPKEAKVASSTGVQTPTTGEGTPSPATAAVMSWIRSDSQRQQLWKEQATRCLKEAAAQNVRNPTDTPKEAATKQLSSMLSSQMNLDIPAGVSEMYKSLITESLKGVNWNQVARNVIDS